MNRPKSCPFLVPVMADWLWVQPVPAYCRRPTGAIRVPASRTLADLCTSPDHASCPGYLDASGQRAREDALIRC